VALAPSVIPPTAGRSIDCGKARVGNGGSDTLAVRSGESWVDWGANGARCNPETAGGIWGKASSWPLGRWGGFDVRYSGPAGLVAPDGVGRVPTESCVSGARPLSYRERNHVRQNGIYKYIFRIYRNMSLSYADALHALFGSGPFSSGEFARRANAPRAAKILSELKRRGLVERLDRGRYRCLAPEERPDLRSSEWNRVRSVVLAGPEPKAWAGRSAVELWTYGGYRVAPSPYYRIFEVAVPASRVSAWKSYLAHRHVVTRSGKRVGARVDLVPVDRVDAVIVDGEPVIPRLAVERLIERHPALFGNARELLRD
jgi:hypothetical protein